MVQDLESDFSCVPTNARRATCARHDVGDTSPGPRTFRESATRETVKSEARIENPNGTRVSRIAPNREIRRDSARMVS